MDSSTIDRNSQSWDLMQIVTAILEKVPKTRSDDRQLILHVLVACGIDIRQSFTSVLLNIPSLESITRTRRKIQKARPDLLPAEEVEADRDDLERKYRKWSVARDNL